MAQFLILAAIEIGLGVAQALLTPRPRQQPIDRGRLDDLRITMVDEGTILPRVYGNRVRLGGVIIDGGHTIEMITTSGGGGGGGKKGGGTPPTNTFSYKKTFAIAWAANQINSFREIKIGDQVLYNVAAAESSYYEAEAPENTLAGGATIITDPLASHRKKVNLPSGASVSFPNVFSETTQFGHISRELVIYYQAPASSSVQVRVNNTTNYGVTLPAASSISTFALGVTLLDGNNEIKITDNAAAAIQIDRIFCFPGEPWEPPCFSENVEVKTPADGRRFFREFPADTPFEIENKAGIHLAELRVHDYRGPMIELSDGRLVTPDHLFEESPGEWLRAAEKFPEKPRVAFEGKVFNLHILSDDPDDHHYIILVDGREWVVHNIKPPDTVTGVIHPTLDYPSDLNDPSAYYNYAPYVDGHGALTTQLPSAGLELYTGTEDQPQSPVLMGLAGRNAGNTPAYRGTVMTVFDQYQFPNGEAQLQNATAELEPLLNMADEILTDLFLLDGKLTATQIDFTALAGIEVEGFIYDRRDALTPYVEALGIAYGFDVLPIDGKVVAVLRGGDSVGTIPEEELYGREEGAEMPHGPVATDHVPDTDIVGSVDVVYLDPSTGKEFHTADRKVTRQVGNSLDPETLTLPLVLTEDQAVAIGKRWLWEKKHAAKPSGFATGPRYRHFVPTDIVTVQTSAKTLRQRLASVQAGFTGLVKFKGVPDKGALYSQTGPGGGVGFEPPPVPFPANSFLWLCDVPALRSGEGGLINYASLCPRGAGAFRGGHLFKEQVPGGGEYEHLLSFPTPGSLGVLAANLAAVSDPSVVDTTSSLVIDLWFDENLFQSRPLAEIQSSFVNVVIVGSGHNVEALQFADVAYSAGTFPYVRRVTLTTLLRGRLDTTAGALVGSATGAQAALLTDAIKPWPDEVAELNQLRNFKGVTAGQALDNAPVTQFASSGRSIPSFAAPTGIVIRRDGANVQALIPPRARTFGETVDYLIDIISPTNTTFTVDPSTDIFTSNAHGLSDGAELPVKSTGTLPAPLSQTKHYYVRDVTTNTFKLALSVGGKAIDITDAGSGTHSFSLILRMLPASSIGAFQQAILEDPATTVITNGSGGWLKTYTTTPSGTSITGFTGNVRRILSDIVVSGASAEATWSANTKIAPTANAKIKMIDVGGTEKFSLEFIVQANSSDFGSVGIAKVVLRFNEAGQTSQLDLGGELVGTRYRIQISGTEVRVYRNYAGPGSPVLFRSKSKVKFPLRVQFDTELRHFFNKITIGGLPDCLTTYPATDQAVDFGGAAPATIRFRIFEQRVYQGAIILGDVTDFTT